MIFLKKKIKNLYKKYIYKIYGKKINNININYNYKNNYFGDININLYNNLIKNNIKKVGIILGNIIKNKINKYIKKYEIKNNFLNFYLKNYFYINFLNIIINKNYKINKFFFKKKNGKKVIIEYSSPNSNKPLHIGHLRNMLIGNTLANIYKLLGYNVLKSQIINDRGIHICKVIISYKLFFNKKKKYKIKGDHLVGKLYLKYEYELQKELNKITKKYNINKKKALKYSKLFKLVNNELIKWENNNKNTINIWKKINNLVYKGFKSTYKKLNIKFDEVLYESKIYLLGKNKVIEGIKNNIFFYDKDNSVYFFYKKKKIILLRKNGTSLYITQEIGTLLYRLKKYKNLTLLIYVVGNEQIEHFKILLKIINILKISINYKILHLSYNTVNYLGKKIKSRYLKNNNLIYIDDLIKNVKNYIIKKNKINIFKKKCIKKNELMAIGAIKYHFLKINPKKIIDFNFKNILEFKGNTGIYIQYTYVRILSILKKNKFNIFLIKKRKTLNLIKDNEKNIIKLILEYDNILNKIKKEYDTSILINYLYKITKKINNFYNYNKIININNIYKKNLRLILCKIILIFLYNNMKILGIPILKKF
ncbi:MAG: arginine--tRNA ligase [Candidatus Shikimatogenerans sp. JK-2022]|nr:arginine--tRNA ligase [Candidatus Shikimatogenerans bostrichidophilus]